MIIFKLSKVPGFSLTWQTERAEDSKIFCQPAAQGISKKIDKTDLETTFSFLQVNF